MFLDSKYILANELTNKMDIHVANISMMRSVFEDNNDFYSMPKKNNCTFINTKANNLPNNIKIGILTNSFTDMSDKLPCTYVRTEYGMTQKEMEKADMIIGKVKISGKDFYQFKPEFVKKMKRKIGYILEEHEAIDCFNKDQIDGYVKLSKNKYFSWY